MAASALAAVAALFVVLLSENDKSLVAVIVIPGIEITELSKPTHIVFRHSAKIPIPLSFIGKVHITQTGEKPTCSKIHPIG